MKAKSLLIATIGCLLGSGAACLAQRMIILNFEDSPVGHVLEFYSDLTQQTIALPSGTYPNITLKSHGRISDQEAKSLILSCLGSNGITLAASQDGITVVFDGRKPSPEAGVTGFAAAKTISPPQPRITDGQRPAIPSGPTSQKTMTDDELRTGLQDYRKMLKQRGLPQPELTPKEKELGVEKE